MDIKKLTPQEQGVLEFVEMALTEASTFFIKRDEMNSAIHLQSVRFSPITDMVETARSKMKHLREGKEFA